ncbi:MAG: extracellular solute-binding protein [Hyphomicrobiaceae bacterium]
MTKLTFQPLRALVSLTAVALMLTMRALPAVGGTPETRHHALSLIGEPKAGPNFTHFDWVNANAPKGGDIKLRALGTFDNLNRFTLKGVGAAGLTLLYAPLMTSSLDEPSTEYGLVAEWVSHPPDFTSATFGLRPEARFHDGKPITPADVVFSLAAIKKANPRYALYFKDVVKAEAIGSHEVRFIFDGPGNRELPVIISALPVLPKHYWEAKDANGEPRDLSKTTLEIPLGSGPYRIASFDTGRNVTYARIKDWWAKDLPVAKGQYNFDQITYIYYRDRLPAFEGFKAGETDFWHENSAKGWATEFNFEAVNKGFVKRQLIPDGDIQAMQGFAFNLRQPQFHDRRVREAFNLAFNFEWANKSMFYDQYRRSGSYFGNSELACRGLPEGEELTALQAVANHLPPELFKTEYKNPTNHAPSDFRNHMRRAAKLLQEAGWTIKDGVRTNAQGMKLRAEVLIAQPSFERLVLAYKKELAKLGIDISVRIVDSAQYIRRLRSFDYDIIVASFGQSHSPGNEQREYWGSAAAGEPGSRNLIGIKNPAIDALIEKIIYARNRAELVARTRALDRVLLWEHYVVPHFHSPNDRIAYWDKFDFPKPGPHHAVPSDAFVRIWWYDREAAEKLKERR